jgi:hypothetical protein
MMHSSATIDAKVRELRNMTFDEIAETILTLEVSLDECGAKLDDALERERAS